MEVINTAEFSGVERSADSASPIVAPRFLDSNKKLGMWLFVVSDGLTFAVLLAGYVYLRFSSVAWPTPFEFYPGLVLASLMTVALLSSGLAMAAAVNSFSRGNLSRARTLIVAAIAGGGLFLAIHGYEWSRLIGEGLTPLSLPQAWRAQWPQSSLGFGSTFYTITGLHMLHVTIGIIYLTLVAIRIRKLSVDDIEIAGLYWHFVDLVWVFVFPLVYVLSINRF